MKKKYKKKIETRNNKKKEIKIKNTQRKRDTKKCRNKREIKTNQIIKIQNSNIEKHGAQEIRKKINK
jgi:hypothetical protein